MANEAAKTQEPDGAARKRQPRRTLNASQLTLSESDISKLLEACENSRERCMLELFIYCGLRRSELAELRIEDIDFSRSVLHLRRTKGHVAREVPLPPSTAKRLQFLLKDEKRDAGLVFPISFRTLNNIIARIGSRAGVSHPVGDGRPLNPHLFRHTFARRYLNAGGRMEILQLLLGHKSITTTIHIYGTPSLDSIREDFARAVKTVEENK